MKTRHHSPYTKNEMTDSCGKAKTSKSTRVKNPS